MSISVDGAQLGRRRRGVGEWRRQLCHRLSSHVCRTVRLRRYDVDVVRVVVAGRRHVLVIRNRVSLDVGRKVDELLHLRCFYVLDRDAVCGASACCFSEPAVTEKEKQKAC